ncbi:MAG: YtxH domain-containing protein [Firmicutes bacterium]|nr:YtxH domain-containing protein [Bacillota bacterium]
MNDRGDFLAGVIVGGLIGFAAGVLFAPASGRETRESIARKGKELVDEAKERKDEVADAVRSKAKEMLRALKEKLPKTKEVREALEQVEKETPGVV